MWCRVKHFLVLILKYTATPDRDLTVGCASCWSLLAKSEVGGPTPGCELVYSQKVGCGGKIMGQVVMDNPLHKGEYACKELVDEKKHQICRRSVPLSSGAQH